MKNNRFFIDNVRFNIYEKDCIMFFIGIREDNSKGLCFKVYLDDKELIYKEDIVKGIEVRKRYIRYMANIGEEHVLYIHLPGDLGNYKQLSIFAEVEEKRDVVWQKSVKLLSQYRKKIYYSIDRILTSRGMTYLNGWVLASEDVEIEIDTKEEVKLSVPIEYEDNYELSGKFPEYRKIPQQFRIELPETQVLGTKILFKIKDFCQTYTIKVKNTVPQNFFQKFCSYIFKAIDYYHRAGAKQFLTRLTKLFFKGNKLGYGKWIKKHMPSSDALDAQRKTKFIRNLKFSVIVPLYKTPEPFLKQMIASVLNQSYENWELCMADGSGDNRLQSILESYIQRDQRICYKNLGANLGISENTNAALKMASGDFIVLLDHDDLLSPDALYECARALENDEQITVIYSDEDKVDMKGHNYFDGHFKPDFNIDLLRSVNYICHMFVVSRIIVDQVKGFNKEFDGAQDYDFIFRCIEKSSKIFHISKVLYHWRSHITSTANNPESKLYAFEAGKRAIEAHYQRVGICADVKYGDVYGVYHTIYHWNKNPLISIIIPNKDHVEDLRKCIESIDTQSTYTNYEYIIVENNSEEQRTFEYYETLEKENPRVKIVVWEGNFNYSAINNFAVGFAEGEYLLLLNNDIEMIGSGGIEELLGYGMREDVGVVGAKLYYPDNTIQHAGVIIGLGGIAGHAFIGVSRFGHGYFSRESCGQDYSAVTAACLLTSKKIFIAVGGFSEDLQVAFNDIDYCLKVRKFGKLIVYNPYAEFYHYESKSRGLENTSEKIQRFNNEIAIFSERWKDILNKGDPYYNENLTLEKSDFSLRS